MNSQNSSHETENILHDLKLRLDSQYLKVRDFIDVDKGIARHRLLINDSNNGIFTILNKGKTYSKKEQLNAAHGIILDLTDFIKTYIKYQSALQNEFELKNSELTQKLFLIEEGNKETDRIVSTNLDEINSNLLNIISTSNLSADTFIGNTKKIEALSELYSKTKKEKESLFKANSILKGKVTELEAELKELNALKIRLRDYNLNHILEELDKYKTPYMETSQLRNQIIKLEEDNQRLENSNTKLYSDIHGKFSEISGRLGNIANKQDIEDSIKLLQSMLDDSNKSNTEMRTELSEKDAENAELRRELEELKKDKGEQDKWIARFDSMLELAKENRQGTIKVEELTTLRTHKPANNPLSLHPSHVAKIYDEHNNHHKKIIHQASNLEQLIANHSK